MEGSSLYECKIHLKKLQSEILLKVLFLNFPRHPTISQLIFIFILNPQVLQIERKTKPVDLWNICSHKSFRKPPGIFNEPEVAAARNGSSEAK